MAFLYHHRSWFVGGSLKLLACLSSCTVACLAACGPIPHRGSPIGLYGHRHASRHAPHSHTPGAAQADPGEANANMGAQVLPSGQLRWPVRGPITSQFGLRDGEHHMGIDIAAPRGTVVLAAASGEVLLSDSRQGYGNVVMVRHDDGLVTVYAHHERNLVQAGQRVTVGQVIARVGSTGHATGPHLHFEVRHDKAAQNPLPYLK